MFRKALLPFLWLTPLTIYTICNIVYSPLSTIKSLTGFGSAAENLILWLCLFILGSVILSPTKAGINLFEKSTLLFRPWMTAFSLIFILLIALVVYVNPHGRYPWNPYPFTTTAAHYQKIVLYNQLNKPPSVIILGSSHAYTISAAYVTKSIGEDTFNMAVGGARILDELALARYIIKNTSQTPRLLIVELIPTNLTEATGQDYMPLNLLPYLPQNNITALLKSVFLDTLSLPSLADAVFLLSNRNAREYISFLPDGTGVRSERSENFYKANIKKQTPDVFTNLTCKSLDKDGKNELDKLVDLAEKNKISIVFYRSPLNAEFFEMVNLKNPLFKKCQALLKGYMQDIITSHPNIFFADLLNYEPISSLREKGYIDVQHLRPEASNLFIDALRPELEKGLQWVNEDH